MEVEEGSYESSSSENIRFKLTSAFFPLDDALKALIVKRTIHLLQTNQQNINSWVGDIKLNEWVQAGILVNLPNKELKKKYVKVRHNWDLSVDQNLISFIKPITELDDEVELTSETIENVFEINCHR